MNCKTVGFTLLLVGAVMAFFPFLVGSDFSLVSDGTTAVPIHIEDAEGNPIENVEIFVFPQYGGDIPGYPNTSPDAVTTNWGEAVVILTTLNTVPVPSTNNSVSSLIGFYHPDYDFMLNFNGEPASDFNFCSTFITVLGGQTSSLWSVTFNENEAPEIETEDPIEEIQFDGESYNTEVIVDDDEETPRVISNSLSFSMVICGLVVAIVGCGFVGYDKYRA